jgi:hypothetical protein
MLQKGRALHPRSIWRLTALKKAGFGHKVARSARIGERGTHQ